MKKASKKVALLIDAENIWYSLHNLHGRKADFGIILEKAAHHGTLSHANAYADFSHLPQAASLELFRCGIRLIHAPSWANGGQEAKSSTDQVLADDAYRLLHESSSISTYVLASGDGHFIPLVSAIRRQGKKTVVLAVPESANHLLVHCADQFVSCLPEEPDGGVEVPSPTEGPLNPDLVQALAQLEEENSYLTFGFALSRLQQVDHANGATLKDALNQMIRLGALERYSYDDPKLGPRPAIRLNHDHPTVVTVFV